jgi:uroporphyrin-III C-methyltransferase/precorrin-2 dehydrogenase/sirohydrochlorin ferrochelatase
MRYFPLFADLHDRPCLVVGGGDLALRKLRLLLSAGARVTVPGPEPGQGTRALLETATGARHLEQRFAPAAVAGHLLVIAAINDPAVNRAVYQAGQAAGVLVNGVDDPANSAFIVPAIVREHPEAWSPLALAG